MGTPSHIRAVGRFRGSTVPITATIKSFLELSGIGRSKLYELLADGSLESIYVGTRRLVLLDSYHRFIECQRAKVRK
jgi:hypothetical protein